MIYISVNLQFLNAKEFLFFSFQMISYFWHLFLITVSLQTHAVKILRHSIPRMVDASNTSELILDCEYVYDSNDLMLVVKWFHNNSPEPIYQWIPDRGVRYVGELLKQRFDMNYSVNPNDIYSKFRALKLRNNITVDLSGNFSCLVSSLAGQDGRQGQMVVYGKCTFHSRNCVINKIPTGFTNSSNT